MPQPRRPRGRKRVRKNVPFGQAHIKTSFNNTIVSLTDKDGNVIAWESAGGAGTGLFFYAGHGMQVAGRKRVKK